jgi:Pentapeptide repeats (8 copies)
VITTEQLELHAKWLRGDDGGQRLDLSGADLRNADLSGADLRNANLSGAFLNGANLRSTDLSGADLSGADLRRANLSGADLYGADLSGAFLRDAYLNDADLYGANGLIIASDAADRLKAVAINALSADDALEMDDWHTCNTTHCIAGWAIYLAGEPGRLLEESHGSAIAGLMLLGAEAHSHFYDSNEDARKWLQEVLEQ